MEYSFFLTRILEFDIQTNLSCFSLPADRVCEKCILLNFVKRSLTNILSFDQFVHILSVIRLADLTFQIKAFCISSDSNLATIKLCLESK